MKEENNSGSKNKWSQLFRKKWFFPAVYLTVAALLLTFVVWYQNLEQVPEAQNDQESTDTATDPFDEEAQTVMEQQEVVKMPVSNLDQAEIVTKFYDYNADEKAKESALVHYNSRYYQSTGVDIAAGEETFDVTASLSGTVEEVKEDPLLGNVVVLSHGKDLKTYYASLAEVNVKEGTDVKQGDVLGTAGQNVFGKEDGVHVHFEIRKGEEPVNPEAYFNQPVSSIKAKDKSESEKTEKESGTTPEDSKSDEKSANPEDETSGTEDDAVNSDDPSGTQEDGAKQEDPSGTPDDSQDDSGNTDEDVTPDDSSNQDGEMSNEGAQSSAANASA
ncbi:stage II sporulation protein [Virgibacillus phasianinus]|uniref:Stage II sporulation protein n=1 Tax=Virgibacillus phasianinus TaxID=2017483 RepID=A0A220U1Z6_9BACI|nr:M23 family metallopeptidase [Virgibacillus phasianinus]ASK62097.1 stage II sporulation protein [Virgibacillus phasianinus]